MMTRETKVGLVVSCSFLCLVGVVLFSKLKEKEGTGTDADAQAREEMMVPPEPTQAEPGAEAVAQGPAAEPTKKEIRSAGPIPAETPELQPASGGLRQASATNPDNTGGGPNPPGMPVPSDSAAFMASLPLATLPTGPNAKESPLPLLPSATLAPLAEAPPVAAPNAKDGRPPPPEEPNKPERPTVVDTKPPSAEGKSETATGTGLVPEPAGTGGNARATGTTPLPVPPSPLTPPLPPLPAPPPAETASPSPASLPVPPSPPESERKSVSTQGTPAALAPAVPIDQSPAPNPDAVPGAAQPGVNLRPPAPPSPVASAVPSGERSAGGATLRGPGAAPAAETTPEIPIRFPTPPAPVPPSNQLAQGPAPAPPVAGGNAVARGNPARLDSPPIPGSRSLESSRTVAEPAPQVESYDEETYRCKANDTFRSISSLFYLTDKYERALQQFNRDHPLAIDLVRQNTGVLPAGQPIYIPPAHILEKKYAAFILQQTAPPPLVASPATPAVGLEAPQPKKPVVPALRPADPSAGIRPSPGNNPLYRVRTNGEMVRDIAKRTLRGNPNERWYDIQRLNPNFDPAQPVRGGTVLRLPADAQVPTENRP